MASCCKSFLVLLFLVSFQINSHELNPARLVLEEKELNKYEVTWLFPINASVNKGEVDLPKICEEGDKSLPYVGSKYSTLELIITCTESIKAKEIHFKGLSRMIDALVTIKYLDGSTFESLVCVENPTLMIPLETTLYPTSYFRLGVEHLLSGIDHILFIIGLVFVVQGIGTLIKTITAFTVAHSLTLVLSVLDLIRISQSLAEALIALTLIYLALEVGEKKKYLRTPWLIAFGFGLIHGFGFAGALAQIGFSSNELGLSLLFFNIGIEIGQIIIIPLALFLIWILNKIYISKASYQFASYSIGGIGSFWLLERLLNIIT